MDYQCPNCYSFNTRKYTANKSGTKRRHCNDCGRHYTVKYTQVKLENEVLRAINTLNQVQNGSITAVQYINETLTQAVDGQVEKTTDKRLGSSIFQADDVTFGYRREEMFRAWNQQLEKQVIAQLDEFLARDIVPQLSWIFETSIQDDTTEEQPSLIQVDYVLETISSRGGHIIDFHLNELEYNNELEARRFKNLQNNLLN